MYFFQSSKSFKLFEVFFQIKLLSIIHSFFFRLGVMCLVWGCVMLLVLVFLNHAAVFRRFRWPWEGPINLTAVVMKRTDCKQVHWFYCCCCFGSADCFWGWVWTSCCWCSCCAVVVGGEASCGCVSLGENGFSVLLLMTDCSFPKKLESPDILPVVKAIDGGLKCFVGVSVCKWSWRSGLLDINNYEGNQLPSNPLIATWLCWAYCWPGLLASESLGSQDVFPGSWCWLLWLLKSLSHKCKVALELLDSLVLGGWRVFPLPCYGCHNHVSECLTSKVSISMPGSCRRLFWWSPVLARESLNHSLWLLANLSNRLFSLFCN